MRLELEQILKFMNEHITALNLVLNEVQPKFSSLLRRVSKILNFAFTITNCLYLKTLLIFQAF
ncbi:MULTISPECIES: hypothetical protein [Campylobacter]|uniref:hypothetical protein n=1 Tax=Campylobacter TaxID=194 RepID=UPI0002E074D0|nr:MULTISPECIES: hypothetical protein [Campylobacter]